MHTASGMSWPLQKPMLSDEKLNKKVMWIMTLSYLRPCLPILAWKHTTIMSERLVGMGKNV